MNDAAQAIIHQPVNYLKNCDVIAFSTNKFYFTNWIGIFGY
ncbi:cysteine desulfurase [Mycoplasmopsis cynos]|nr:hypothetical protein [Mycoplasmopsis cynos]WAM04117.1 cysteine desulfurase [Mycoplasmopsis cynos]